MQEKRFNVLFLCQGNSARSILAEAILNKIGSDKFRAFSAGSRPKPQPNPRALTLLHAMGLPTEGLRSKSVDEFSAAGAPRMEFIFTLCDETAGEVCDIWTDHPLTAHWGIPDPAAVEGADFEQDRAFADAYRMLRRRIEAFVALPLATLDRLALQQELDAIGLMGAVARA